MVARKLEGGSSQPASRTETVPEISLGLTTSAEMETVAGA